MSQDELEFLFTEDEETGNVNPINYNVTNKNDVRKTPLEFGNPNSNSQDSLVEEFSKKCKNLEKVNNDLKTQNDNFLMEINNLKKLMKTHLKSRSEELRKQWAAQTFITFERNRIKRKFKLLIEKEKKKLVELKLNAKLVYEKNMNTLDSTFDEKVESLNNNGRNDFENLFK